MLQNIKVDIIYYKTNTDFEMEFNLCGCCRMRLLTDKSQDKKSLVHSLARAVSRSKVIIIAGSLFGEDGIINVVSNAIGKSLSEVDNKLYGISGSDKISVINGATPLVTSEGYFGGCIIESGPQSMILLSDNKNIRKSIMTSLIHPYIEELCTIDFKARAESPIKPLPESAPDPSPVVPTPPAFEASEDTDDNTDISETTENTETEVLDEEPQEEIISEADTSAEPEINDIFSESENNTEETDAKVDEAEEDNTTDEKTAAADDGVILSGGMIFETDDYRISADDVMPIDDEVDLYLEPTKLKKGKMDYYNAKYAQNTDEGKYYHSDDDFSEMPHGKASGNLLILIMSVILLIILAVLCYCIFYVPAKDGVSASEYLRDIFDILSGRK